MCLEIMQEKISYTSNAVAVKVLEYFILQYEFSFGQVAHTANSWVFILTLSVVYRNLVRKQRENVKWFYKHLF